MSSSDEEVDWHNVKTITSFDWDGDGGQQGTSDTGDPNGSTKVIDDSRSVRENFLDAIATKPTAPVSLLVESLIHQLCSMIHTDKDEAEKMYQIICVHLYNMHLIDETFSMKEFDVMRGQFSRALYEIASASNGTTANALALQIDRPFEAASITLSRYNRDFDEIEFIARGGFGSVYKARNRLDGTEYAIKKVNIKYRTVERLNKHFDEVKTFAKLNHVNIVPYNTAWLEPKFDTAPTPADAPATKTNPMRKQQNSMKSIPDAFPTDIQSTTSDDDDTDLETGSSDSDIETNLDRKPNACVKFSCKYSKDESSDFIQFEHDAADDVIDGANLSQPHSVKEKSKKGKRALWKVTNNADKVPQPKMCWATLYIQMAFRPLTLRAWLKERNKATDFDSFFKDFIRKSVHQLYGTMADDDDADDNAPSTSAVSRYRDRRQHQRRRTSSKAALEYNLSTTWTNVDVTINIFKQALNALHYIHSHDIVHHDIKPSNIFIDCDRTGDFYIQLGDFGLACPIHSKHAPQEIFGTPIYAAPEQMVGQCNVKSDLFSLGIILIELLIPFTTDMERIKTLNSARKGILPQNIPPNMKKIIEKILQNQRHRPDVGQMRDLVKQLHFDTNDDQNCDSNKIDDEAGLEYTRKTYSHKMTKKQIVSESYCKRTTVNKRSDTSISSDDLNTILKKKMDLKRRMTSELNALEEEIKNLKFKLEEDKSEKRE